MSVKGHRSRVADHRRYRACPLWRHGTRGNAAVLSILHLTLTRRWFDMIASGKKREEYRDITSHWNARLAGRRYDAVRFRNGYMPDSPSMLVECKGIRLGFGNPAWGAVSQRLVHIVELGEMIEPNKEISSP